MSKELRNFKSKMFDQKVMEDHLRRRLDEVSNFLIMGLMDVNLYCRTESGKSGFSCPSKDLPMKRYSDEFEEDIKEHLNKLGFKFSSDWSNTELDIVILIEKL